MTPRPPSTHSPSSPEAATGTPGAFSVAFVAPGKPVSTNQTYRTGRGKWFKDPKAAAWQAKVSLLARQAMRGALPYAGEVQVTIWFWFADRRPDADGPVKGLLDRLAPFVIQNDRQVAHYEVTKGVDKANPRTVVLVRSWPPVVGPTEEFRQAWLERWEEP